MPMPSNWYQHAFSLSLSFFSVFSLSLSFFLSFFLSLSLSLSFFLFFSLSIVVLNREKEIVDLLLFCLALFFLCFLSSFIYFFVCLFVSFLLSLSIFRSDMVSFFCVTFFFLSRAPCFCRWCPMALNSTCIDPLARREARACETSPNKQKKPIILTLLPDTP
jgi:hypothetical protein